MLQITRWIEKKDISYKDRYTYIDNLQRVTWKVVPYLDAKGREDAIEYWFGDRRDNNILANPKYDCSKMKVIEVCAYDTRGQKHIYIIDTSAWLLNDNGKTIEHMYIN
jgi:hypothetical protein